MKTKFYLALAAMGVIALATSCSKDAAEPALAADGETAKVSFTFAAPENAATRAYYGEYGSKSDVLAKDLYFDIYVVKEAGQYESIYKTTQKVDEEVSYPYTLTVELLRGQKYAIACWAQNENCEAYNTDDLRKVEVDYTLMSAHDIENDAFFGSEEFTVGGDAASIQKNVVLTRPFAQINLGLLDQEWDMSTTQFGFTPETVVLEIQEMVNDRLDVLTGKATNEATENWTTFNGDVLYTNSAKPTISYNNKTYNQLSMNYVLVNEKETLTLFYTLKAGDKSLVITPENGLTYVPVWRNYRTNILAGSGDGSSALTSSVIFTIDVQPDYETPENTCDVVAQQFIEDLQTGGVDGTVTLQTDLIIDGEDNAIDFTGFEVNEAVKVIDLGGHTFSSVRNTFQIAPNCNLRITNGSIIGVYGISLGKNSNLTLDNLNITTDEDFVYPNGGCTINVLSGTYTLTILDPATSPEYDVEKDSEFACDYGLTMGSVPSDAGSSQITVTGGTFVNYNPAYNYYSRQLQPTWQVYGDQGWVPLTHKCESTGENTWTVSKK